MAVMIRAVVFDVEEVIAHTAFDVTDAALAAFRPGLTTRQLNAARSSPPLDVLWARYSVGALTPQAYWGPVLAQVGIEDGLAVETYRATLRHAWWGCFDEGVLDIMADLRRRGIRLGILSNSAPEHEERLALLEPQVDVAHFSHRTGHRKPDPEAFLGIAEALGVPPEEIFFTDDKRRNTEAAEAVGMHALTFQGPTHLAAHLRQLGLL